MTARERVQVAIVGAGPAGLVLSHLLAREGISSIVLESRAREYVERRVRAGVLEQGTVDLITELGLDGRLRREGLRHDAVEWRVNGRAHRVPVGELTGGRGVTVYGQQELVKDLIAARLHTREPLVFDAADVTLREIEGERALLRYRHEDSLREVECDFIAGCDGSHGVCRAAIPHQMMSTADHAFPFAWLGILADVAPSTDVVIYAHHPRGFALHSMRSPTLSRLYLQCDPGDDVSQWPDDRIWEELHRRLAVDGDWQLAEGPILSRSITPMRSVVSEPMQYGRLFLAGDAAHIMPPTGAKGLNLAVADVSVLAAALASWYHDRDRSALSAYSSTCLARVWRVQRFAAWMTWMFHRWQIPGEFIGRLQALELDHTCTSEQAARAMAENYAGLPIPTGHPRPVRRQTVRRPARRVRVRPSAAGGIAAAATGTRHSPMT